MGKRGPVPFSPDWNQVDKLCAIHATGNEIAAWFDVDYKTLERACKREKGVKLGEWIEQKMLIGNISLRRNQWKAQESGNTAMLIFLGKNYLGQKDKSDEEIDAMKDMPKSFNLTFNEVDASKPE